MNVFEIERTLYAGVAATMVGCFFGVIIGALARFKGYSFLAWFGTGGAVLLGAIVLAFQPRVRGVGLTEEEVMHKTQQGNRVGWILSLIIYICILLSVVVWLTSMSFQAVDSEEFLQLYFVPALQWSEWPWIVASCLLLARFLYMPRSDKSLLTIAAFTLIAIQLGWPLFGYWIDAMGWFEDPNSATLRIVGFTIQQFTSMSILFLCFVRDRTQKSPIRLAFVVHGLA